MVTTNIPDSACFAVLGLFKGPIFYTSSVIYSVDPYKDICVVLRRKKHLGAWGMAEGRDRFVLTSQSDRSPSGLF